MPILQQIRTCITEVLFAHIFADYEDNQQINKLIQTQILPQYSNEIGTGTYGNIFLHDKTVYKLMILKSSGNETNMKSIIEIAVSHRQFYKREYQVHKLANQIKDLTCYVYNFHSYGPICYITMEYLEEYITLMDYMQCVDAYNLQNNDIISRQLINKMELLQKIKVYHGDIKQTNIMIKLQDIDKNKKIVTDVKLIDFGKSYTYNEIQEQSHNEYIRYQREKNYYKCWQMLQKRKLMFHQNFHYSSIVQYIFNEYEYETYYKLSYYIDAHSMAFTILHMYNGSYINDFKRGNYRENFEQFIAFYIILFGPQFIATFISFGSRIHQATKQNGKAEESDYSYSSFENDDFMIPLSDLDGNTEQSDLRIPETLKNLISIRNNQFCVAKSIQNQISQIQSRDGQNLEFYINKIQDKKIQKWINETVYTFKQIQSLFIPSINSKVKGK